MDIEIDVYKYCYVALILWITLKVTDCLFISGNPSSDFLRQKHFGWTTRTLNEYLLQQVKRRSWRDQSANYKDEAN